MTTDIDDRRSTDHHGHDIIDPLYVGIVTVSSSRAAEADSDPDDPGGDTIEECFEAEGH
jgi:molybdopterin adenylyltransferase